MNHQGHGHGAPAAAGPPGRSLGMIANLVTVAGISGVLIVVVFQLTLPTILANKAEALKRAVFEVIPHAKQVVTFVAADGVLQPTADTQAKGERVYAGYDEHNTLMGVAIEAQGQGYQDVIKVLYGYAPESGNLVGMRVLESKETPGLGDKIGKDAAFLSNFAALDVRLRDDGQGLQHEIAVVKSGTKTERWQIDAITGATISSKAVGKLLNESVRQAIPRVRQNLPALKKGS